MGLSELLLAVATPPPIPLSSAGVDAGSTAISAPAAAILGALIALVSGLVGALLQRKSAKEQRAATVELDDRQRQEETNRMLRWAAEQAISDVSRTSLLGVTVLKSLKDSEPLVARDRRLISAVLAVVYGPVLPPAEPADGQDEVSSETEPQGKPEGDGATSGTE